MNISEHTEVFVQEMKRRNYKTGKALMAIMALVGGLFATVTFAVIIYKILI